MIKLEEGTMSLAPIDMQELDLRRHFSRFALDAEQTSHGTGSRIRKQTGV